LGQRAQGIVKRSPTGWYCISTRWRTDGGLDKPNQNLGPGDEFQVCQEVCVIAQCCDVIDILRAGGDGERICASAVQILCACVTQRPACLPVQFFKRDVRYGGGCDGKCWGVDVVIVDVWIGVASQRCLRGCQQNEDRCEAFSHVARVAEARRVCKRGRARFSKGRLHEPCDPWPGVLPVERLGGGAAPGALRRPRGICRERKGRCLDDFGASG